eukprot:m.6410 g.6410  ORF g.6410 m.6410 type:complete len:58 (+) comp3529_c0_seq1:1181-1354(+)
MAKAPVEYAALASTRNSVGHMDTICLTGTRIILYAIVLVETSLTRLLQLTVCHKYIE